MLTVNTNIASLIAQNNLNQVTKNLRVNQERLSSGLRINSAADDAAGLAISNKMTSQIMGMNQAMRNAGDGISLAQTAEGGLQEITDLLHRGRELSVQASNETLTDDDLASLNAEFLQLVNEIDRIAKGTGFNEKNILDGGQAFGGSVAFHIGPDTTVNDRISMDLQNMTAGAFDEVAFADVVTASGSTTWVSGDKVSIDITQGGETHTVEHTFASGSLGLSDLISGLDDNAGDITGLEVDITSDGSNGLQIEPKTGEDPFTHTGLQGNNVDHGDITESVDANYGLGIIGLSIGDVDGAQAAITNIDKAIESVDSFRSELGAVQNRLDSTIANLMNAAQNLTEARERILDSDIAKEAAEQTQNDVRRQAAAAVLTQANQDPQLVLQLLGG